MSDAVELTVGAAWFIADEVGAGTFPCVLAITPPYRDASERAAFASQQTAELARLQVITDGTLIPSVRQWIQIVCNPERWLELRYVASTSSGDLLRGLVARRTGQTVVALRNAQLVTFTALDIDDPRTLARVVTAGLGDRPPASFEEFALPTRVGARADRQIREGADLSALMDHLDIPASARDVVRAVFDGPRRYVEVVAGQRNGATRQITDVGVAVVDTSVGRVLVSPARAFDGEWVSTFTPGTTIAAALALERLSASLPEGQWFPSARRTRDLTTQKC
ncbi:ESX secretion-associated protein EspG [Mycolicibacterium komossense]|uniref:ESX secretion-associated protein EspG n=1 Tax=Mycolicibacterium komossense TaxID=1779 RepID=A0ABT3CGD8_9MYCO|nr:ESX secretion-associated protein EspG [Mycolicibacterium komossense]MCV7228484.1 ESX secretion-associated protein EspG [Mycolicibacterium komossense]